MANSILIIEDEELLSLEMARHFKRDKWRPLIAATLKEAHRLLVEQGISPMIVISDMTLPDGSALDLLEKVGVGESEWIFLTGYGTIADSVRALRLGAFDYLEKPVDFPRLDMVIAAAARSVRANRRLNDASRQASRLYGVDSFLGKSALVREVKEFLTRLSAAPFSALIISGETGTGKGVAARILHHNGLRSNGPMIEVNCAALPAELMESELFGHEAGSFTGSTGKRRGLMEQADGGTLFLDEIGEMPLDLQPKLLRFLESGEVLPLGETRPVAVDVRIVAATNADLEQLVNEGRFREDLYYRLNVVRLRVPPLRERREEVPLLVQAMLERFAREAQRDPIRVSEAAMEYLTLYHWPGNARQLANELRRLSVLSEPGAVVMPEHLSAEIAASRPPSGVTRAITDAELLVRTDQPLGAATEHVERVLIAQALDQQGGNVEKAAQALGLSRKGLFLKRQRLGML